MTFKADAALSDHAVDLCQRLLRIDTTNPPGNELEAAELLATELSEAGLEPQVLQSAPGRGNVVVRHAGTAAKPPLLLTAHLDVVEADASKWDHPPFSGVIADGCLWGRGAIDMKNHAAMSVALLCRLARDKRKLDRDLIFAGVADEEAGCTYGSGWLCDEHPDLVRAQYALGEGGGFNIFLGGKRFFTVQVAEKGFCWVKARVRGEPGHGSMPREDSAIIKLSEALARLGKRGLPVHSTSVVSAFLDAVIAAQPPALRPLLAAAREPRLLSKLVSLLPDKGVARGVAAMLSNTASPTLLSAGSQVNVIPGLAEADLDCRTLPGQSDDDLLRELGDVLGDGVGLEVLRSAPPIETQAASPLYDAICATLADHDPEAAAVPYLLPGFTDAKSFTRLGARWYGFSPVRMPKSMRFAEMYHGHNERIPIDGLRWGTSVLSEVVMRFAGG